MTGLRHKLVNIPGRLRSIVSYLPYRDKSLSYESYWDWREPTNLAARHRVFASWIPDGSRVLDVACGDGAFAKYLQEEKACDVVAIDLSSAAIARAKDKGIDARVMDVANESPDERFDVVVLSAFIEHVVNSEDVIDRYLAIGGEMLISIPNIAYIEHRLRLLFGHFPCQWAFHPSEHVRFWSVRDFKGELAQMGIQIVECVADDGVPLLRHLWKNLFGQDICFRLRHAV